MPPGRWMPAALHRRRGGLEVWLMSKRGGPERGSRCEPPSRAETVSSDRTFTQSAIGSAVPHRVRWPGIWVTGPLLFGAATVTGMFASIRHTISLPLLH